MGSSTRSSRCHRLHMRKLLILVLLNSATFVSAQSEELKPGPYSFKKYQQHINNAYKFIELEDIEMGCSELRMASTVLKANLNLLKQYKPDFDFFKSRATVKYLIEGGCRYVTKHRSIRATSQLPWPLHLLPQYGENACAGA